MNRGHFGSRLCFRSDHSTFDFVVESAWGSMAFARPQYFAIGVVLGQFSLLDAAEENSDTCDLASGACAADDDTMSAMQLRGGTPGDLAQEPGYGKYWKLVDAYKVADELKYSRASDKNPLPECLQGLVYLDQQCLTYDQMPEEERAFPCLGRAPPNKWVREYVTSFGNWNATTRCFIAERVGWTFGDPKYAGSICAGGGITACQKNADTHPDPCQVGAKFGSTFGGKLFAWYLQRTTSGWNRLTPYFFPIMSKYPVHQVVDGHGKKTKWFKDYIKEAMQKKCGPDAGEYGGRRGCRRSLWADEGKIAVCTAASDEAV